MKENSSTFGIIVNVGNLSSTRTRLNVLGRDPEPIHLSALQRGPGATFKAVGSVLAKAVKDYSKGTSVSIFQPVTSVPRMTQSHCTVFLLTQWVKHSYRSSRKPQMTMLEFLVADLEEPGDASS
ncbi:hypothetical protein GWK47_021807 [Chionoecetes opilio]|uniref:Uncharacterized protein n=1 Tax=Chionoecetes opilio TaxID=41210 RepID=A0A8J5CE56_CHIOP|nr:hypothetical protein GWK47_021807 [Chionoecetes opilio]